MCFGEKNRTPINFSTKKNGRGLFFVAIVGGNGEEVMPTNTGFNERQNPIVNSEASP